ncbi:MAG: tetratricopeptide repeat protein [Lysobacterales bacterium]
MRAAQPEDRVLAERLAAEFAVQAGDTDAALGHLQAAAEASDDPTDARKALRLALAQSRFDAAEAVAARWQQLQPDAPALRAYQVALALAQGRSEPAWALSRTLAAEDTKTLAEALAAVPIRERVLPFIERSIEASDDLELAIRWTAFVDRLDETGMAVILASRLIERFPDRSESWALRAGLNRKQEDFAAARDDFAAAIARKPDARRLRLALAETLASSADPAAAAAVLAELRPGDDDTLNAEIAYAAKAEDQKLLRSAYQALRDLPLPRPAGRVSRLGAVAELLGEPKTAIDWYLAMPDDPERSRAVLRAALLMAEDGELDRALKTIRQLREQGIDKQAELQSSYQVEASLLTDAGRAAEAIAVYDQALLVMPNDRELRFARALALAAQGQADAAEQDLLILLEQNPDDPATLNALGYTLADSNVRLPEALALIQRALALAPKDAAIMDSMGWVLFRLGQIGDAISWLRSAQAADPSAEIAAHLGEALWADGQRQAASEVWDKARAQSPDDRVLNDTLRRHGL